MTVSCNDGVTIMCNEGVTIMCNDGVTIMCNDGVTIMKKYVALENINNFVTIYKNINNLFHIL